MQSKKFEKLISSGRKKIKSDKFYSTLYLFIGIYYFLTSSISLFFSRLFLKKKDYFKKDPLITIITPTYNRAEILTERAIKSVLSQTYKNFEYLIIGDGCTDNTEKKIKLINDPRIKFFNIKRKILYKKNIENLWFVGPVRALNYGLKKAEGIWIARIDDDIIWDKRHLEKSLKFCIKNNFEFVTASAVTVRFKKKKVVKYTVINEKKIGGSNTFFFISYLKFFKFNLFCWMKNKHRVNDVDLFDRLTKAGVRTGFRDETSMYNLPRPGDKTLGIDQMIIDKKSYYRKYFN